MKLKIGKGVGLCPVRIILFGITLFASVVAVSIFATACGTTGETGATTNTTTNTEPETATTADNDPDAAPQEESPSAGTLTATDTTDKPATSVQNQLVGQDLPGRIRAELAALETKASEWLPHMKYGISLAVLSIDSTLSIDSAGPGATVPDSGDTDASGPGDTDPGTPNIDSASFGINENDFFVSASAAKIYWLAVATVLEGTESVEPLQSAALCFSNNHAAGSVIALVGIDAINSFLHTTAEMRNTFLLRWSFNEDLEPAEQHWRNLSPVGYNTTTPADATSFYRQLYNSTLLSKEDSRTLLEWLAEASNCEHRQSQPLAMPMSLRLPDDVEVINKAGWLPPGCCALATSTLLDAGIITTPQATYALTIATQGGDVSQQAYQQQTNFIAYASCRLHTAVDGATTNGTATDSTITDNTITGEDACQRAGDRNISDRDISDRDTSDRDATASDLANDSAGDSAS